MVAGCALMHTSHTDQHSCANCIRPRPGDTAKRSARRREGQCKPLVVWGDWRRAAAHACSPGGGPIPGGQAGVAAVRKPVASQHMAGVRCANRRCGLGQPQSSNGAVSIRGCTSVGACAGRAQGSCQDVGRPGQALLRTQPLWSQEKRAAAPPAAARTGSPSPATTVHNTTTTPVLRGGGSSRGPRAGRRRAANCRWPTAPAQARGGRFAGRQDKRAGHSPRTVRGGATRGCAPQCQWWWCCCCCFAMPACVQCAQTPRSTAQHGGAGVRQPQHSAQRAPHAPPASVYPSPSTHREGFLWSF